MIQSILIANRGEIATRIIRTCQRLGIHAIAVFSDIDRRAPFVLQADEAVALEGESPRDSYLDMDKIIQAASATKAQAVHPGYGFLSENADFAEKCRQAGLIFIGPPASSINAMGSKSIAKRMMEEAGVPLVPGYHGEEQEPDQLMSHAQKIGYPLLLKASAGGGGKGMRVVWDSQEFKTELISAQREADSAFGNKHILLERFVTQPRHVEVQIFFDQSGNGVYLFDRDCSIQRRHQKIIEEAPAPGLTDSLRAEMGEAALACGRKVDYVGAGTVEFLLDADHRFYFMEMNTRLQVEHPVTEMITGQDLVEWQIRVAEGNPLPLCQDELKPQGHALEVRLYAEDPERQFLPSTGEITHLTLPAKNDHLRMDMGIEENSIISPFYDPMIGKLIVWDQDRLRAIGRMKSALRQCCIGGIKNNVEFLSRVIDVPAFQKADINTHFLEAHQSDLQVANEPTYSVLLAAAFVYLTDYSNRSNPPNAVGDPYSPWNTHDGWRLNSDGWFALELVHHQQPYVFRICRHEDTWKVEYADTVASLWGVWRDDRLLLYINKNTHRFSAFKDSEGVHVYEGAAAFSFHLPHFGIQENESQDVDLTAPMHGKIVSLLVTPTEEVEQGRPLIVMEAMKMEHTVIAPRDGRIVKLLCESGQTVENGQPLVEMEFHGDE